MSTFGLHPLHACEPKIRNLERSSEVETSSTPICLTGEVRGSSGEEAPLPGPFAVRYCPRGMKIRGGIPVRPRSLSKEAVRQKTIGQNKSAKRKDKPVESDADFELDFELDEKPGSTSGQSANPLFKKKAGGVLREVRKDKIREQGETSTESELTADELEPGAAPSVAEV